MQSGWVGLVTLVVLAPAVAAPVPKALPPVYHPTTVGTKWVMTSSKHRMTYTVTASEEKDGETLVVIESEVEGQSGKGEDRRVVSKAGVFGTGEPDKRVAFLKLPAKKGDRWVIEGHGAPGRDEWAGVAGEVEKVKVPAGEFDALRVDTEVLSGGKVTGRMTFWYATGCGVVKKDVNGDVWVMESFEKGKR